MGEWSPSHLIVAAIAVATIIGQLLIVLTRLKTVTERLEKRMDTQDETIRQQGEMFYNALGRLEERLDKRFVEVNQRFDETNQRTDGLRSEMNQRLSDMNEEIRDVRTEVNQRLSDMNEEIRDVRTEVNQRLSDMNASIQQMNQNHIEHLNRHHSS